MARPIPNVAASSRTGSPVAASRRSCSCLSGLSFGGLVTGRRRAWRDLRDAARRSRPSSNSSSARAPPRRRVRVNPFAQGTQRESTFTKRSDGAGDFGDGASQPVDRGDNYGVAGPGVVEHRSQPRSGCLGRSGELVGEHPRRINAGGDERSALSIEVLAGGADPCVTDYRCHTHTVSPPTCIEEGVRHALRV